MLAAGFGPPLSFPGPHFQPARNVTKAPQAMTAPNAVIPAKAGIQRRRLLKSRRGLTSLAVKSASSHSRE
jgi:hypothetical protein